MTAKFGTTDTIFALATPPGRAALALVRLSGERTRGVLELLTRRECPEVRRASLRALYDPNYGDKIDTALVTYFAGPASFSGEDCADLSVHGGRSVIASLVRVLGQLEGVRPASPGEFSKRAFLNGKLDLTQAEAIADLIDSETEFQRRQALRVLDGALGRKVEQWRLRVLRVAAELEGALDFSDESDVQTRGSLELLEDCLNLENDIRRELSTARNSQSLRSGFTIVVAGPPNVGKSTLFNALVGRDAAIVTHVAGTTRDLIEGHLDLDGVPVTLVDSAGIRDTADLVEQIGISRSLGAVQTADLVLWLNSQSVRHNAPEIAAPVMQVWSKADLEQGPNGTFGVSAFIPESIAKLRAELRARALSVVGDGTQGVLLRRRHSDALTGCASGLASLSANLRAGMIELAAEDCRSICGQLGSLNGLIVVEDVLSEVFDRFCIGK